MSAAEAGKPCTCRADIEAKLKARFAEQEPTAHSHEAKLTGYAYVIEGNAMVSKGCMGIEATAVFPLKKGGEKAKTVKSSMMFNYCPFCGQKYEQAAA